MLTLSTVSRIRRATDCTLSSPNEDQELPASRTGRRGGVARNLRQGLVSTYELRRSITARQKQLGESRCRCVQHDRQSFPVRRTGDSKWEVKAGGTVPAVTFRRVNRCTKRSFANTTFPRSDSRLEHHQSNHGVTRAPCALFLATDGESRPPPHRLRDDVHHRPDGHPESRRHEREVDPALRGI